MAKVKPYEAIVLPDRYWWINSSTGKLVQFSRHEDPLFSNAFNGDYAYPAVVEVWRTPKGGTTNFRIPLLWWNYVWTINTPAAGQFIRRVNAGWVNRVNADQWPATWPYQAWIPKDLSKYKGDMPMVEGIVSVGARVRVLDHKNGSAKIKTYRYKDKPPKGKLPANMCHHFSAINKDGSITKVGGLDIVLPYLSQDGYGYIPLNRIKKVK